MPVNDNELRHFVFAHSAPLFCWRFDLDTTHVECCLDNSWGFILEREWQRDSLSTHLCSLNWSRPEQDDSRKEVQQLRLEQDDSEWLVKVISLWSIFVFHWQGRVVRLVCLLMYTLVQTQFLEGHCSVLHSAPTLIKHTWSRSTEIIKVFRIRNVLTEVSWCWLDPNRAELWPSRNWAWDHCLNSLTDWRYNYEKLFSAICKY